MSSHYELTNTFIPGKGHQIDKVAGTKREKAVYFWGHKSDSALSLAIATKTVASANAALERNSKKAP